MNQEIKPIGRVELYAQPTNEWGDREDHFDAYIVMDEAGRSALIAALIAGVESIECIGESGGQYTLKLEEYKNESHQ